MATYTFVIIFLVYSINVGVNSSPDLLKTMTLSFTKALDICKKEMDLTDSVDVDFLNFWKDDYAVENRLAGCVIMCLASKLELVDHTGILIHGNSHAFAKNHGADDAKAQQLVDLLHGCQITVGMQGDDCMKALNTMNCFKAEIRKLDWTPTMDLIIGEALAEI